MKRMKWSGICCFVFIFLALALNANATVATAPFTGAPLSGVAVLAGTTQTNAVGTTVTGGDVVSPTITEAGPLNVIGGSKITVAGTVTTDQTALTAAKTNAFNQAGCTSVGNAITGPVTLPAGLYCTPAAGALLLNGVLTLSGSSTDVWVFQVGSALTAAIGSSVHFEGGASPCNVYWEVGSKADITTAGPFAGTIMAGTSITLGTTAGGNTLNGRALAKAAVTIAGTETIVSGCSAGSSIVLSPVHSSIVCGSGSSVTKIATVTVGGNPAPDGTSVTFTVKVGTVDTGLGFAVTTVGGIATFTFTPSGSLTSSTPYTVVATLSDGTSSNITDVTCSGSTSQDVCLTTPRPTFATPIVLGGSVVIFSVQAPGGLLSLVAITPPTNNATVVIAPFDSGTTLAVGAIATKVNSNLGATVELFATDLCGHTRTLDPVFATITISASKSKAKDFDFDHQEVARFGGIGRTEGIVILHNGHPGVESLVISVNGSQFKTQLKDDQTKKIDISSALFHGKNTVRVAAFGDSGSSVDLIISDGN